MIKDDGHVLHFTSPKVQASLTANTFAITGNCEEKRKQHMSSLVCVDYHCCCSSDRNAPWPVQPVGDKGKFSPRALLVIHYVRCDTAARGC